MSGLAIYFAHAAINGPYGVLIRVQVLHEIEAAKVERADLQARVDLLTVVMHEIGHLLGLKTDEAGDHDLMSEELIAGRRRLPHDLIFADTPDDDDDDDADEQHRASGRRGRLAFLQDERERSFRDIRRRLFF